MCHITGGGLLNFRRLADYGFSITAPWKSLPSSGGCRRPAISMVLRYRTFNMGMGYAFIVPPGSVATIESAIPGARVVGEVAEEPGVWLRVSISGKSGKSRPTTRRTPS